MSEDWLVTSTHPITARELASAARDFAEVVSVRPDDTGACNVVVDAHDTALVWIGVSQPVREPGEGSRRVHWTEVVQPASPHTHASIVDAASEADAIARAVGGTTQCLSRVRGTESGRGGMAPPTPDQACDVLTESCAIFLQTRPVLRLTAWVALAMEWAGAHGLMAVFLTPGTTQLSPVLHHCADRGGCLWVRQGAEGMHNGSTGRAVAWDGAQFVPSEAAGCRACEGNVWDVIIEAERLRPLSEEGHVGSFVEALHEACALDQPHSWGDLEAPDKAWSVAEVGAHSHSAYPAQSLILFRSEAVDGLATVVPQPIGAHEKVLCVGRADHLLPRATSLGRVGELMLRAGSDLCVLGYRQPTLTQPDHSGATGNVLPGVIGFAPARFGGFDASAMLMDPDTGAGIVGIDVGVTAQGVVIAFGPPRSSSDEASAALIAAWDRILAALAERDSVCALARTQAHRQAVHQA
ncbi:MAG: DUF6177 family protein [Ornithinimicrobium sp.]